MKVQPDPDSPFAVDAILGDLDDTAWDGTGDPSSLIALLKGIHAQLADIAANTTPA